MNSEHTPQTITQTQYKLIAVTVFLSVLVTLAVIKLIATYTPENILSSTFEQSPRGTAVSTTTIRGIDEIVPNVVEQTAPAVVSIIISAEVPVIERYFDEYSPFDDFFGGRGFGFRIPRERQIGTEEREIGGGTGFFVSPDGYIITNRHVVDLDDVDYSIITDDGDTYDVAVVAKDPSLDIAVLKVDADQPFPYLEFGESQSLRLGSSVIAIGNALAEFPNTVSVGVISGLSRDIIAGDQFGRSFESLEGVIQTDAAINQGNSGGPLIDLSGRVVGMNVAVAGNSENIGFALPAESVQKVYESVEEHGEIIRPFLGVRYIQITESLAARNNLSVDYGVLIVRGDTREQLAVIPGSAADKAGLEENDIILEIDGVKLDGSRSLANILREYSVGDAITLRILHDGEERTEIVELEQAPNDL